MKQIKHFDPKPQITNNITTNHFIMTFQGNKEGRDSHPDGNQDIRKVDPLPWR